jgi:hypothetical protein
LSRETMRPSLRTRWRRALRFSLSSMG